MFSFFKKQKNIKFSQGFAVLFAVLLSSFLITLGISIFNISLKEIQITTSARDSQIAYYVADSARECAIYWDLKEGAFPVCSDSSCNQIRNANGDLIDVGNTYTSNIECNNTPISLTFDKASTTFSVSKNDFFHASSTNLSAPVSDINIKNEYYPSINGVVTTIEARGHNTGIIGRRVERGITEIIQ